MYDKTIKSLEYGENFRKVVLNHFGKDEVWSFHPCYDYILVSSHGKIKSSFSRKILNTRISNDGYEVVSIIPHFKSRSKSRLVSRLVAETFFNFVYTELYEANHMNGDKLDNSIFNINWLTREENLKHAKETGLLRPRFGEDNGNFRHSQSDVNQIFKMKKENISVKDIAQRFNLTITIIYHILKRRKVVL